MQESYQATQAAYKHLLSACTKDVFAQLLKDKVGEILHLNVMFPANPHDPTLVIGLVKTAVFYKHAL